MITYNYTDEQRRETIKLLQKIQLNLPWKKARAECENIDSAAKGIYEILDMVKYQTNQPEEKTTRKIYNPVTNTHYNITERSSKYKEPGDIKGLWRKKNE